MSIEGPNFSDFAKDVEKERAYQQESLNRRLAEEQRIAQLETASRVKLTELVQIAQLIGDEVTAGRGQSLDPYIELFIAVYDPVLVHTKKHPTDYVTKPFAKGWELIAATRSTFIEDYEYKGQRGTIISTDGKLYTFDNSAPCSIEPISGTSPLERFRISYSYEFNPNSQGANVECLASWVSQVNQGLARFIVQHDIKI